MKLITEVQVPVYPFSLDHHMPGMMMGSCFTENIGKIMQDYRFPVLVNPFGTIYNPASVLNGLQNLHQKKEYTGKDLNQHEGRWFSFDHYTRFSSRDQDECLRKINDIFTSAKSHFEQISYLVITWGTAWVYREKETDRVVCNCHKIPATHFKRHRMEVGEITGIYERYLEKLFHYMPGVRVLLTVSPVRHWKDGAHGNQLSKATLLLAAEALRRRFPSQVFYFPSYEIVMDELRDYRYYDSDMLHVGDTATRYIWERFSGALVSDEAQEVIRDLEPWLRLSRHRATDTSSEAETELESLKDRKRGILRKKYPFIDI
jgi:hypothetical protein